MMWIIKNSEIVSPTLSWCQETVRSSRSFWVRHKILRKYKSSFKSRLLFIWL